jgi:hypothetical protein
MNEHVEYSAKPASGITRFLWFCAGADEEILKYSSYADHVKYVGLGGVVLATGVMAALSMGFAIHTIFDGNWYATIPIAITWALIVFNLDRFIVSSTGKGDGKDTISWKEFLNALPRLAMAILLGLTISAPLETQIFQVEIQRELDNVKQQFVQFKIGQIETNYELLKKEKDTARIEKFRKLESLEVQKKQYEDNIMAETRIGYCGRKCDTLRAQQKRFLDQSYNPAMEDYKKADEDFASLLLKKKNEIDSMKNATKAEKTGFLDELMALEKLASENKVISTRDPITQEIKKEIVTHKAAIPIWMVRLLFMIIEIVPVIFKLMLIKSPYDYMSENVNQILEAKQGISLQHIPDENNKLHNIKENYNPKRITSIVEHQNKMEEENARAAITAFAEKERKDIEQNPDKYISP